MALCQVIVTVCTSSPTVTRAVEDRALTHLQIEVAPPAPLVPMEELHREVAQMPTELALQLIIEPFDETDVQAGKRPAA